MWLRPSQYRNMLPRLDGLLLSWAGFIRCHPPDSCLRVRKDFNSFRDRVSLHCQLLRVGVSGALSVIRLLLVAHMRVDALPGEAVLHTAAYPANPSPSRDSSVNVIRSGRSFSASSLQSRQWGNLSIHKSPHYASSDCREGVGGEKQTHFPAISISSAHSPLTSYPPHTSTQMIFSRVSTQCTPWTEDRSFASGTGTASIGRGGGFLSIGSTGRCDSDPFSFGKTSWRAFW